MKATSVTPYITSTTDNLAAYAPITLTGGASFSGTIATGSIVTYYGVSATAPTLQAPGGLKAAPVQGNTSSQISLSWADNSSSETGYTVERSTDGTNWNVLTAALATNTTVYTDTGRAENTTYFYRVEAQDGATPSAYSAVASASTVLVAPTGFTGTAITGGIRLNWTISSTASTGVRIDRSLDAVTWTTLAPIASRATTYSDTIANYDANQTYYYRLRNTAGTTISTLAAWNSGIKTPTNFTSTRLTGRQVTLNWTNVALNASGAWIEQQIGTSTTWTRISPTGLEAAAGTYQLGGLTPGTTYRFRLRTSGAADTVYSAYTSTLTVNTPAATGLPIAWLKADETSGATLVDSANNFNDGMLTGSYRFTAGKTGNAVKLTGGYATLPTGVVAGLSDFTIATWVNPTSATNWMRVFDFGAGGGNAMFFTPRADSGLPRFGITTSAGAQQRVNSNIAIALNTWTHVAITLSGNTATLYLNGVVSGTNTAMTRRPSELGQTTQNYIGKSPNSWDPTLAGSIDDFRIYDRALTVDEVRTLTTPDLPAPWVAADIGVPALAGSAAYNSTGGVWTVAGGGADIWDAADQFQFVNQSASGDFALTARVSNLTNSNVRAKAAVMIRESAAANAAYALVAVRPDGQVAFQYRRTAGASAENNTLFGDAGVKYVKIERAAGMITGYYSTDGINWTATDPAVYVYMPKAVTAGLAVTSHNTAQLATATFDNVKLGAAAVVSSVSFNGGAAQRSRFTSVTVTFNTAVVPAAGVLSIVRRGDVEAFAATVANPSGDGMTFTLTFTGAGMESGSLPDGVYDLVVTGALVRDALGQELAGGNYRYSLNRLFGDINGDAFVNTADQTQFNVALNNAAAYNAAFDINADGAINSTDAAAFTARLNSSLPVAAFPSAMGWTSSGPLLSAPSNVTHTNAVSVKDPTVVRYNGKWYVFATWASTTGGWSLVYYSFSDCSQPTLVMSRPTSAEMFEGSQTYKIAGTNKYLTIIEAYSGSGGRRFFTSYTADRLDGAWTALGTSYTNPFAALTNVTFPAGTAAWSDNFSHGDLVRSTCDETMTIDPANLQLLYQGLDGSQVPSGTNYSQLPWQLGLLTFSNKNAPVNLNATVASSARVNLSWIDRSTTEAGFLVERATDASFTAGLTRITLAAGATSYADLTAASNTTYFYRVTTLLSGGLIDGMTAAAAVATPAVAPALALFAVNDNSIQRSTITRITLRFDTPVDLAAGAIVLSGIGGSPTDVAYTQTASGDRMTYVLTFPTLPGGSLMDGNYQVRVAAAQVAAAGSTTTMAADAVHTFHRLFGDYTGDRNVSIVDFNVFATAFGKTSGMVGYYVAFDYDNDGMIGIVDFNELAQRFGATI